MQRPPQRQPTPTRLPWDDVRLFLALCRSRTLRDAARLLGVDTSTVSRRLVALEETLGATLFDRGRDGVSPTELASSLRPVAETIEERVALFTNVAEGFEQQVEGMLTMTCPPDLAEVIVVPMLAALLARHPGLRLTIDPSEAVLDLTRREADLALRVVRPARGDLVVKKLTTIRWLLATSPALAEALGPLRRWEDVAWIGWGERLASIPSARWIGERFSQREPVLRSDSMVTQAAAARAGLGVALVPEPSIAHYGLVPLRLSRRLRVPASPFPENELFLVTHRTLRDVPRVRVVWEALVARFDNDRASLGSGR